jgi:hypothetical protein
MLSLMPRTRQDLEAAATRAAVMLDRLDPATTPAEDTTDLRAIASAMTDLSLAETALTEAVAAAHAGGRSWARIGMVLGVSKEAARQRYGTSIRGEESSGRSR